MYLDRKSSRRRLREAEHARANRLDIVRSWSRGQVSRRELLRMGLFTAGGALLSMNGLSPFARSAYADVPTGTPPSPIPSALAFTQALPRLKALPRKSVFDLSPFPTRESNQTYNRRKGLGPVEGRPPGPYWAHQRWAEFFPRVAVETATRPLSGGFRLHPRLPELDANRVWTFGGTLPPKLIQARYGEPMLFRHHNHLPLDMADNGGFGRNSLSTHLHNGHTPAESDGYPGAFFFPGQFYDYRWPHTLAGTDTINPDATDPRAGAPDDSGGIVKVPGDWRETMSTLWFHDHMFDFTAQNVQKGGAAFLLLYSALDRGNEEIEDGVNLRLPSGRSKPWGNLDYDVPLLVQDQALDSSGQPFFDVFNLDGFLGDVMTVNGALKPYLEVERRKYRFRILNACASRFLKVALSDGSSFHWISNDGNLLARPLLVNQLDRQGTAERCDIVVDFSRYPIGTRLHLVNLTEHDDGRGPRRDTPLAEALAGGGRDPGVGAFLELRVARNPRQPDRSRVPDVLVPLPERVQVVRERRFTFGRSGGIDEVSPWTIRVDDGDGQVADVRRISAAPRPGTAEVWHLVNAGGGWDHPVHIHFEECQTLARATGAIPVAVPPHEALGRKDVWRLNSEGSVSVYLQFREFTGSFVEHCHNTVHEDHAMLLRFDVHAGPVKLPSPVPTPAGVTFIDSEDS